ncbi:MAG: hypothetical protein ACWA41_04665 [Putridiphycobacter sp.]
MRRINETEKINIVSLVKFIILILILQGCKSPISEDDNKLKINEANKKEKQEVDLTFIFNHSEYTLMVSPDIQLYEENQGIPIEVIGDSVMFKNQMSLIRRKYKKSKKELLLEFIDYREKNVYQFFDSLMSKDSVLVLSLDPNLPFSNVYTDSINCISYTNNILSSGVVKKN